MLELGAKSDEEHRALQKVLEEAGVDVMVLVGAHMKALFEEYQKTNLLNKKVYWEASPVTVAKNIRAVIQPGDAILLKGSQGMRIELVTKALLIDPELAASYLCRQSLDWQHKPFTVPEE
jgi:UDP-N-acetylmuramoyl-tripeptide--D-alanyl-D-alanine ligase